MIEIYCAYSGTNWIKFCSDDETILKEYFNKLNVPTRPSHIIISNADYSLYTYAKSVLWTPRIFIENYNVLYDDQKITQGHFQKLLIRIKKLAKKIN